MDIDLFEQLLTEPGQSALADAVALEPTPDTFLRCFTRLSKRHPDDLAKAALETAILRERARSKFTRSDRMYFARVALEQSSREAVSRCRAGRFEPFATVADLCSGIGGDTIGLASQCARVVAVDRDPLHLAMARENVRAYDLHDRAEFVRADVTRLSLGGIDAYFCDPDRRTDGKRRLSLRECQPSVPQLLDAVGSSPTGIKLAPGVSWSELNEYDAEAEFISHEGELKECVLWFGDLRTTPRRVTVLPGPHTLTDDGESPHLDLSEPREYLYDPDPSITRSGLLSHLASRIDASAFDYEVGYLTSSCHTPTPFAAAYVIDERMPYNLKRLRAALRERDVGSVIIHKRGSSVDVNGLIRQLKLRGQHHQHVVLTRVDGRATVFLVRPVAG